MGFAPFGARFATGFSAGLAFVAFVFAGGVFAFTVTVLAFVLVALLATTTLLVSAVFLLFDALFGARLAAGAVAFGFNLFFMGECLCFCLLRAAWRGL